MDNKPVYRSKDYPLELGTEKWWKQMGYTPVQRDQCAAYYRNTKSPLYSRSQVTEINTKNAQVLREHYQKWYGKKNEAVLDELNRRIHLMLAHSFSFKPGVYRKMTIPARHNYLRGIIIVKTYLKKFIDLYRIPINGDEILEDVINSFYGQKHTRYRIYFTGEVHYLFKDIYFQTEEDARQIIFSILITHGYQVTCDKRNYYASKDNERFNGYLRKYEYVDLAEDIDLNFNKLICPCLRKQTPQESINARRYMNQLNNFLFPHHKGILAQIGFTPFHVYKSNVNYYVLELTVTESIAFYLPDFGSFSEFNRRQLLERLAQDIYELWDKVEFGKVPENISKLYQLVLSEVMNLPERNRNTILKYE